MGPANRREGKRGVIRSAAASQSAEASQYEGGRTRFVKGSTWRSNMLFHFTYTVQEGFVCKIVVFTTKKRNKWLLSVQPHVEKCPYYVQVFLRTRNKRSTKHWQYPWCVSIGVSTNGKLAASKQTGWGWRKKVPRMRAIGVPNNGKIAHSEQSKWGPCKK